MIAKVSTLNVTEDQEEMYGDNYFEILYIWFGFRHADWQTKGIFHIVRYCPDVTMRLER